MNASSQDLSFMDDSPVLLLNDHCSLTNDH
jgi:hypothetical protein